jgi:hypothetical protein
MKLMKTKTITIDDLDAALILPGLKEGLTKVKQDISILLLTKKRDLTNEEREELPTNLQHLPQAELREQIDGWVSLRMHYESLIETFDYEMWI